MKILYFTWMTLVDHARSASIFLEVIGVLGFIGAMSAASSIRPDFLFTWVNGYTLAIALVTTFNIIRRGSRAEYYVMIAKPLGRRGFFLGKLLAALTLVAASDALLLIIVPTMYYGHIKPAIQPGQMVNSIIACTLSGIAMITLAALLTPLLTATIWRIVALLVLVLALYPAHQSAWLAPVLPLFSLFELALAPFFGAIHLSATDSYDGMSIAGLIGCLLYIGIFLSASLTILDRKDLMLD